MRSISASPTSTPWSRKVITTVPDPEAALDEFARVTKVGGEIILVNHLGAEAGPRRLFEQSFAPVARRLGWRPEFRWQRLARWVERHSGVRLLERRAMPPVGHFSLIRFEPGARTKLRRRRGDRVWVCSAKNHHPGCVS
jgi:hypothetical protein